MNDELELELRKALQRVPAPDGFAERVLQRLPEHNNSGAYAWWYMVAAALVLCALFFGGFQYNRQKRERDAQKAERQVIFAFSLAAEKLQQVNVKLEHSSPDVNLQKKQGRQYE